MRTAIVLSGQTTALGVVRSLGSMGVPVTLIHYDDQDFAHRSRFVQQSLRAPHPEHDEKGFVDFLVDYGRQTPGEVLFPAADESLVAVSRHKTRLDPYFKVACTEWEVSRRFIDKQYTYALAESCGVPSPRTLTPLSLEEARSGASDLGFPCLIKPCQSHLFYHRFGRKMIRVETLGQLQEAFNMAADAGLDVMVQEIIPGDDREVVNYKSYFWGGEPLAEFTAVHIRNAPPWFGSPRVAVSRKVPEVIDPGRRLLKGLGYSGYSCTEFKRDPRNGIYKLMEVNGRHNLSTLLAVRCGINFPWLHYRHLSEDIAPQGSEFQEEVYWIDLFRDVGYTAIYLAREGQSPSDYLRPYLQPHILAILDRTDLGPFRKRAASIAKKTLLNIFSRNKGREDAPAEPGLEGNGKLARNNLLKGEGR